MRHLLRSICTRTGDKITFRHEAACGAEARCLCTDVRLVDCPACLNILEIRHGRTSRNLF
jgi:hypothetical protein